MIDIHSHIVFDVDDGPKTLKESLNLISESYRQGVRTIVSTSHRRKDMFETPEETIRANFLQVKKAAEEKFPDLTILYGGELYYTEDLRQKLEKGLVHNLTTGETYQGTALPPFIQEIAKAGGLVEFAKHRK